MHEATLYDINYADAMFAMHATMHATMQVRPLQLVSSFIKRWLSPVNFELKVTTESTAPSQAQQHNTKGMGHRPYAVLPKLHYLIHGSQAYSNIICR